MPSTKIMDIDIHDDWVDPKLGSNSKDFDDELMCLPWNNLPGFPWWSGGNAHGYKPQSFQLLVAYNQTEEIWSNHIFQKYTQKLCDPVQNGGVLLNQHDILNDSITQIYQMSYLLITLRLQNSSCIEFVGRV